MVGVGGGWGRPIGIGWGGGQDPRLYSFCWSARNWPFGLASASSGHAKWPLEPAFASVGRSNWPPEPASASLDGRVSLLSPPRLRWGARTGRSRLLGLAGTLDQTEPNENERNLTPSLPGGASQGGAMDACTQHRGEHIACMKCMGTRSYLCIEVSFRFHCSIFRLTI